MPELQLIELTLIDDHPQNPRVMYREDVIEAIVANLGDEWPQKHALHVRPVDGRYQTLSGHTRKRAAIRKEFSKVWCWVEEMDDSRAYWELVTSNAQGELSPLEIGMHCLNCEATAQGKKGAGIQGYADRIGKTRQYVQQLRQAAEVISTSQVDLRSFLDRVQHLSAIHAMPKPCWKLCVEWLEKSDVSAVKIQEKVKKAKDFLKDHGITDQWKKNYLPPNACGAAVFCGAQPNVFGILQKIATEFLESLVDHEDLAGDWVSWLDGNSGGESWDMKKVQDKRNEIEGIRMQRESAPPKEDYSVILADPPWKYDFAETDNRKVENQYPTATVDEICQHMGTGWAPLVADDAVLFLWATAPKLREAIKVMSEWGFEYKTHAVWDKEKIGMGYWFRGQHELLLVGTRGGMSPPEQSDRVSSVFREKRNGHSQKPVCVYEAIESMFPAAKRFEMYQRTAREGWDGGGLEA